MRIRFLMFGILLALVACSDLADRTNSLVYDAADYGYTAAEIGLSRAEMQKRLKNAMETINKGE